MKLSELNKFQNGKTRIFLSLYNIDIGFKVCESDMPFFFKLEIPLKLRQRDKTFERYGNGGA